ncbi:hypothetical protein EC912_1034 [Luteibacter rhizovicinus]|uniref:Uncharacterized protein n=1 Tax=Luteibacter rhizovicinus TaxID=242606 RepID=A0A4R3YQ61_9GAMM|nr:hypothetical protein [Luteibacter rhizovicinus]TCV94521.1 hypothetical protein EC912_1034 [Luteibacter rhizovicinus]
MKAPNLIAVTASLLIAGASVFVLRSFDDRISTLAAAPAMINGVRVIDLAPVTVRPTAADVREATRTSEATLDNAAAAIRRNAEERAMALLGSQLAMPYYSFGNVLSRTAKD